VAARLAGIIAGNVLLGGIGLIAVGTLSGVTSTRGMKRDGVYADGRVLVVSSSTDPTGHVLLLRFSAVKKLDKDGNVATIEYLDTVQSEGSVPASAVVTDISGPVHV
jgi:hypothetical protein